MKATGAMTGTDGEMLPWQQTFQGRTWKDMLKGNADPESKKLHFALFRRGLVTLEKDEDGRSVAQKQWGGIKSLGRRVRRVRQRDEPMEAEGDCE